MRDVVFAAILASLVLVVVALAAVVGQASSHPDCYEDEAIVWAGDGHDKCVPLDNLTGRG